MSSYSVVLSEPRLTVGNWQATVTAGQILTVGTPPSFGQDVADYLVEHGVLVPCDDPAPVATVEDVPVEPPIEEPVPAPEITPDPEVAP